MPIMAMQIQMRSGQLFIKVITNTAACGIVVITKPRTLWQENQGPAMLWPE